MSDMHERFARTELLIGPEGLDKLAGFHVAVFGLGGVGSFAAEALARAGIGHLTLIDHDTVSLTNLNRQLVALENTIGSPKVDVMAGRIAVINPQAVITGRREFYAAERREDFFAEKPDYVVDAIDTVAAKIDLVLACHEYGVPCISSMGTGNKLDPTRFRVVDISATHTDPLAKVMRVELRNRGISRGLKVVFSDEPPRPSRDDAGIGETRPSGHPVPGSIAFVPPVAGMILASVVVRELLGIEVAAPAK